MYAEHLQAELLRRMQSDASALEHCVRGMEELLGGRASGSAEQELSRGGDAVRRCREWCVLTVCRNSAGLFAHLHQRCSVKGRTTKARNC